jgi:hypothetical protein
MIKQPISDCDTNAPVITDQPQINQGSSSSVSSTAANLAKSLNEASPEFDKSTNQVTPQLNNVESCLNAMIAVFDALSNSHEINLYHGNPSVENFVFQDTGVAASGARSLKASFLNSLSVPEAKVNRLRAHDDVKIALREFGGPLLVAAEVNGHRKLNIFKMHLESVVNFADQDEPNTMESAATMLEHLSALEQLVLLSPRDYSVLSVQPWGPLKAKEVSRVFPTAYAETGRPPLKKPRP